METKVTCLYNKHQKDGCWSFMPSKKKMCWIHYDKLAVKQQKHFIKKKIS